MQAHVALTLLLALPLLAGATGLATEPPAAWVRGSGMFDGAAAQAEWLLVDGDVASYLVETADGRIATCQRGNGTLQGPAGASARGACGGNSRPEADNETVLWIGSSAAGRVEGIFTHENAEAILPVTTQGTPSVWPGVALAAAATLGLALSAALAVLWHRERGLTLHLARRLAAQRGNGTKRGKSGDEKDQVARILVRSRN